MTFEIDLMPHLFLINFSSHSLSCVGLVLLDREHIFLKRAALVDFKKEIVRGFSHLGFKSVSRTCSIQRYKD